MSLWANSKIYLYMIHSDMDISISSFTFLCGLHDTTLNICSTKVQKMIQTFKAINSDKLDSPSIVLCDYIIFVPSYDHNEKFSEMF